MSDIGAFAVAEPPSGPAGGDLSGTYPDPEVVTVLNGETPATLSASQTFTGSNSYTGPLVADNLFGLNSVQTYTANGSIAGGTNVAIIMPTVSTAITITLGTPGNNQFLIVCNLGTVSSTLAAPAAGTIIGNGASYTMATGSVAILWYSKSVTGTTDGWIILSYGVNA